MTLRELKNSLSKFPGDFLDIHILTLTLNPITKERQYGLVTSVCYSENVTPVIFLADEEMTKVLLDEDTPGLDGKPFILPE